MSAHSADYVAAPEVNFVCCSAAAPELRDDDDPTVWAIICGRCGKDICFLLNRAEAPPLTDTEVWVLPGNAEIVVTWRGKKYDWPTCPDSREVRLIDGSECGPVSRQSPADPHSTAAGFAEKVQNPPPS